MMSSGSILRIRSLVPKKKKKKAPSGQNQTLRSQTSVIALKIIANFTLFHLVKGRARTFRQLGFPIPICNTHIQEFAPATTLPTYQEKRTDCYTHTRNESAS